MKSKDAHCEKGAARELFEALLRAALIGALLLSTVSFAFAQAYGVKGAHGGAAVRGPHGGAAVRTPNGGAAARGPNGAAAVRGPNGGVAARGPSGGAVVAGGAALPHGYIAALPRGYRPVYVRGVRYYTVGGVYYRPQMYSGRTVYVSVRL